ncbi:ferric iron uptake transcriptional regulator [Sutterella sp.]|uniref:ferric iron uptake transcriptional regulator n=1 Tax=Sutterella sp. TaxID=1981025 RepID=UPI0026E06A14|nr:ferric iron uptake transcriptional regulator [Sutterella sp.]MDO5532527.1 ferric iron uptake transcriptional regulator [Sutterella sp.]
MKEATPNQQSNDLKTMGLKVTVPRLKILDLFQKLSESREAGKRHLSAEEVYKLLLNENSDIGLATVYRVLTQFENAGILVRHHFDEGRATYELQEGRHHDHIVCVSCGKVEEFVDPEIEKAQRQVATRLGYEMTDHSLVLYGICTECREKNHKGDEVEEL